MGGLSDQITGPLGLWNFPILNLILGNTQQDDVVITEVVRNDEGRIVALEEYFFYQIL